VFHRKIGPCKNTQHAQGIPVLRLTVIAGGKMPRTQLPDREDARRRPSGGAGRSPLQKIYRKIGLCESARRAQGIAVVRPRRLPEREDGPT
jgi:hypothetical protein